MSFGDNSSLVFFFNPHRKTDKLLIVFIGNHDNFMVPGVFLNRCHAPFYNLRCIFSAFRMLFIDLLQQSYFDPTFPSTTATVLNRIIISNPGLHFLIYSVSSLTTSSKSVILLLPLTCHIPVSPGLNASLER